ncbi:MAG: 50S ribosomal protein L4 [Rhodospirillales bacterium RIFCSPLOWO2_12_FULL_58_28]|nr:MAG: 50S ribosomal protein L4 [Rhodospirillales bacterium RIFCSPLOWO2_02_FULL_58_16]OHC79699.1 MAG: 50S ribosomal protein L4 [Rhodospirillales bacterium RIFCSPLOWO2_12_FULL_58_28]
MNLDVISLDNKKVGSIDLDKSVFGVEVRADLLARTVKWQLAKRRAGTHKTKGRGEVSGTGAKPFKQKGTGRARQGTHRAPQMRGGGIVFGPVVRSYAHKLPKKVRVLALKSALSSKQAEGKLVVIESTAMKAPKTADLVKRLAKLGWVSALVIDGAEVDGNFALAAANIVGINVLPSRGANVYDIMRSGTLVLTMDAVEKLVERLK